MTYQTEIDPLVETKIETPVTKKKVYTLGGVVVFLLAALSFLAGQNSANNRLYLKTASSLTGIKTDLDQDLNARKIGGMLPGKSEGLYLRSPYLFNNKPIWDRKDRQKFAFYNGDGKWAITEYVYRNKFNYQSGTRGYLVTSTNKAEDFIDAGFPGEQTMIIGKTYADCQGMYMPSGDLFNGKIIWDRSDGKRFAFYNSDGKWAITGSQWRDGFVGQKGWKGAFVTSDYSTQSFNNAWFKGQTARTQ